MDVVKTINNHNDERNDVPNPGAKPIGNSNFYIYYRNNHLSIALNL